MFSFRSIIKSGLPSTFSLPTRWQMCAINSRVRETAAGVSETRAISVPAETAGPLSLAAEAIGGVSSLQPTAPPVGELTGLRYGVRGQRLLSGEGDATITAGMLI